MASSKKKSAVEPNPSKFASMLADGGKYVVFAVALAGALVGAGFLIVKFTEKNVVPAADFREEYQLAPDKILLSPWPMPLYVQPDPRENVFAQLQRNGSVSILDPTLPERITAAFQQNPWVENVRSVTREYPATVKVELEFRRPALMVLIDIPNSSNSRPYAVDPHGISLPTTNDCFTPLEIAKYPRLVGVDKPPAAGEGKLWGDSRVIGGAEIAAELLPIWEKLQLKCIVPRAITPQASPGAVQSSQYGDYHFEIIGPGNKRILWGKSPFDKNSQTRTPAQKAKYLVDLQAELGSLDKYHENVIDLNRP
jgi:hypothetical protein